MKNDTFKVSANGGTTCGERTKLVTRCNEGYIYQDANESICNQRYQKNNRGPDGSLDPDGEGYIKCFYNSANRTCDLWPGQWSRPHPARARHAPLGQEYAKFCGQRPRGWPAATGPAPAPAPPAPAPGATTPENPVSEERVHEEIAGTVGTQLLCILGGPKVQQLSLCNPPEPGKFSKTCIGNWPDWKDGKYPNDCMCPDSHPNVQNFKGQWRCY